MDIFEETKRAGSKAVAGVTASSQQMANVVLPLAGDVSSWVQRIPLYRAESPADTFGKEVYKKRFAQGMVRLNIFLSSF